MPSVFQIQKETGFNVYVKSRCRGGRWAHFLLFHPFINADRLRKATRSCRSEKIKPNFPPLCSIHHWLLKLSLIKVNMSNKQPETCRRTPWNSVSPVRGPRRIHPVDYRPEGEVFAPTAAVAMETSRCNSTNYQVVNRSCRNTNLMLKAAEERKGRFIFSYLNTGVTTLHPPASSMFWCFVVEFVSHLSQVLENEMCCRGLWEVWTQGCPPIKRPLCWKMFV